ncbi:TIGR01620 family protein [Aliigemmobacter aestuarii]|uniref:TIGR01620 family protein n=1 Tax=Aliigemmobacter aestuarii TaxID=1445661 RepID=A0A4S3MTK2_9RHOB|nr:YcjF family protein [Gemmobacter aestuarii]THD85857.1 TIGR01620 family protein [Gemmobacter aestuarii]
MAGPADPGLAPPVPEAAAANGQAMQIAMRATGVGQGGGLGRLAAWVFAALFTFVLSVAAWNFVNGLLASNALLGAVAFGLILLASLLALILGLREWLAYLRLGRIEGLRDRAARARAGDLAEARATVDAVARIYAGREDLAWARARFGERRAQVMDADALLDLAETELMAPLDQAARRSIETAARQVATVTALVPMALADVAAALFSNLRMVRQMAQIYGGRSGSLGSWRLMRRVFSHLVATGAVALTDDLIGSVAGGGILSKLSRRFGEGLVNGALTARVGVAAMELCRPMPFHTLPKPKVTNLVGRALAGVFERDEADAGSGKPD